MTEGKDLKLENEWRGKSQIMAWAPCRFEPGLVSEREAMGSGWPQDLEQHGGVGTLQLCGPVGGHTKPRKDKQGFGSHKSL